MFGLREATVNSLGHWGFHDSLLAAVAILALTDLKDFDSESDSTCHENHETTDFHLTTKD